MQLDENITPDAALKELGRRLELHRLQRDRTQAEMAEEAGIGRATLQRLERGQSVQTASLVKLMRALRLLTPLDAALPGQVRFPIAELERERRRERRRVRHGRAGQTTSGQATSGSPETTEAWRWGDEPEASR